MNDDITRDEALKYIEILDKCFGVKKDNIRASKFVGNIIKAKYSHFVVRQAVDRVIENEERYPVYAVLKRYCDEEKEKVQREKLYMINSLKDEAYICVRENNRGRCGAKRGTKKMCEYCDAKTEPMPTPEEMTKMLEEKGLLYKKEIRNLIIH